MSKNPIKRVPLWLGAVYGPKRLQIYDVKVTGFFASGAFSLGLPSEVADFIHRHCRCSHCGAQIEMNLSRCKCANPTQLHMHLEVACHGENTWELFQSMLRREEQRMMSRRRRQQVKRNGGAFTKEEIAELFQIQEGLCYFCGEEIAVGMSANRLHIDHYDPIAYGGKNDVTNLVLTCARCNLAKGATHGDYFERLARKLRNPANGRKLGCMRRRLNRYRALDHSQ